MHRVSKQQVEPESRVPGSGMQKSEGTFHRNENKSQFAQSVKSQVVDVRTSSSEVFLRYSSKLSPISNPNLLQNSEKFSFNHLSTCEITETPNDPFSRKFSDKLNNLNVAFLTKTGTWKLTSASGEWPANPQRRTQAENLIRVEKQRIGGRV